MLYILLNTSVAWVTAEAQLATLRILDVRYAYMYVSVLAQKTKIWKFASSLYT